MNGCPYRDREDAGNLELDWLEVQLKMYRDRNMQVCVLKLDWIEHVDIKSGRCTSRVGVTSECRSIKADRRGRSCSTVSRNVFSGVCEFQFNWRRE